MKNIKSRVRFTTPSVDQRKNRKKYQKSFETSHINTFQDKLQRITNKKA